MPSCWSSDVCSRSEEHTSELQSHDNLVCRLLLEKKNTFVTDARGGGGRCTWPTAVGPLDVRPPPRVPRPADLRCWVGPHPERAFLLFFFKYPAPPEISLLPQPPPLRT